MRLSHYWHVTAEETPETSPLHCLKGPYHW